MDKRMGRKSERYWHRHFSVSPPCFSLSLTHFLSHSPLIVSLSDPLRLLFIVIFRDILCHLPILRQILRQRQTTERQGGREKRSRKERKMFTLLEKLTDDVVA